MQLARPRDGRRVGNAGMEGRPEDTEAPAGGVLVGSRWALLVDRSAMATDSGSDG